MADFLTQKHYDMHRNGGLPNVARLDAGVLAAPAASEMAPEGAAPRSMLSDAERRDVSRLRLRNALQGGHADVALQLLDEQPNASKAMSIDGRLPLHIALEHGGKANVGVICALGEMNPKAAMAGDPTNGGALPLHTALEKGHEDVVVW